MSVPRWVAVVRLRLRSLFQKRSTERELNDELQFHLERAADDYIARGLSPTAARRAALLRLGGIEQRKEQCRETRGLAWQLDVFWLDARMSVRTLLKSRTVTTAAVASLALGIGANTAVFSLVSAILLQPLPYPDPGRLVRVSARQDKQPDRTLPATAPEYWAWKNQATLFEAMGTSQANPADLGSDESGAPAERIWVQTFTPSVFTVLGIRPALGRPQREDEAPLGGPAPVLIISDGLWQRRYNRDPHVLNRTVRIDGEPRTIVGVMPPGFAFPGQDEMDAWAPIAISARQLQGSARGFSVVARLKPGVTILQAQAEMDRIAAEIARDFPARNAGWGVLVEPLQTALYGNFQEPLLLLAGAVGLVLLIACANVAGLLLARASGRTTEMAVRAAIGANRARIVRQLLTESVLLAAAGGLAGVGVGWVAMKVLIVTAPATLPRLQGVGLDHAVLGYTAALAALSGLVFGLVPALQASQPHLADALRASARVAGDRGRHRLRSGMVTAQVALAVVLLVGATLMIRSLLALQTSDLGGDPTDVLAFDVMFSQTRFQKGVGTYAGRPLVEVSPIPSQAYTRIWEALQTVPGVQSAAGINFVPFAAAALPNVPFTVEGRPEPATPEEALYVAARTAIATPNLFATMRIPILRGRDFTTRDTEATPWGIVINTAMAEKFWAAEDPVGQRVTLSAVQDERSREIIGIVGNVRLTPFDLRPEPIMYVLHNQQPSHARGGLSNWQRLQMTFLVRTEQPGATMLPLLRQTLTDIDPERPMTEVRRVEDLVGSRLDQTRYTVIVLGVFAAVAVALAVVGLYGVVAYGVAQRTREIGIRLALGASRGAILTLVLRHTVAIVTVALALGIVAAFAASGLVSSVLWSVTPTDPVTYASVCAVMTMVALIAAAVPARRAIRVAPTVALRQD